MGISERKERERKSRRKEILDAAEILFFSQGYDKVSMDAIAQAVELNKATIYLYFKNKETLFSAVVLRGVRILFRKYTECMETQVPGMTKVALIGQIYFLFSKEQPYYNPLIQDYYNQKFPRRILALLRFGRCSRNPVQSCAMQSRKASMTGQSGMILTQS